MIAALALVAAAQLAVDPRGNLGTGLDTFGPWRSHFGRVAKARQLGQERFDLVILGTSRSLNGIDPSLEAWGQRRVYNASMVGTNLFETKYVFDYLMAHQPPREVLIEASLLAFGSSRTTARDFEDSAFNPDRERIETVLANLLGLESLRHAVRLSLKWIGAVPAELVPRNDGLRMRIGDPESTRELFATVITAFATDSDTYAGFEFSEERLALLETMVDRAASEGISVTIYTPPVHALQLEAIRRLGLQEDYDHMRRKLARMTERFDPTSLRYWDFTGFSGPMTESLPEEEGAPMAWYFDSSHFRTKLGAVVVERMFGEGIGDSPLPAIGIQLSPQNIDVHLAAEALDHAAWKASHAPELRWLEALL